jgi:hypothetical protein
MPPLYDVDVKTMSAPEHTSFSFDVNSGFMSGFILTVREAVVVQLLKPFTVRMYTPLNDSSGLGINGFSTKKSIKGCIK